MERRDLHAAALAVVFFAVAAAAQEDLERSVLELDYPVRDLEYPSEAVKGEVQALKIEETETEVKIELPGDVLFDFDKADIRVDAEPELVRVAEIIKKYKNPRVLVEGHTDAKGSDSYNQQLSERRADSVRNWLAKKGAIGGVMTTKGWGRSKPVASNQNPDGSDNPEGRQKNRRVEITIKKS